MFLVKIQQKRVFGVGSTIVSYSSETIAPYNQLEPLINIQNSQSDLDYLQFLLDLLEDSNFFHKTSKIRLHHQLLELIQL